jgi:hypothetical protein
MSTVHRARGVLKIKRRNTASVVGRANAVATGIDDNPTVFTAPNPTSAAIRAQIVVVNDAEIVAATHAKGAATTRNVARNGLVGMMETELTYMQGVADKSATWDQAVATLQAGGLPVAIVPTHFKPILGVTQGSASGSVVLDANASELTVGLKGKFSFNWQSTVDGKTFVGLPSTPNHKTTVANLAPLTSCGFRVSVTDAAGVAGEWSQMLPTHLVEHLPAVELRAVA